MFKMDPDMLETALCGDKSSAAVSPESGISSASPLSWQVCNNFSSNMYKAGWYKFPYFF